MDWMTIAELAGGAGAFGALLYLARSAAGLLRRRPSTAQPDLTQLEDAVRDARFAYELEEETGKCPNRLNVLLLACQQAERDLEAATSGEAAEIDVPVDLRPRNERLLSGGSHFRPVPRFKPVTALMTRDNP